MSVNFKWDIFLSHSIHDLRRVKRLAQNLKEHNLRVWLDDWEISPGGHISTLVEEGLKHSHKLVLCLSKTAVNSDWVHRKLAAILFKDPLNREGRYIPVLLEDCQIPDSLQPFSHIDLSSNYNQGFKKLLEACQPKTAFSSDNIKAISKQLEDCLEQEAELCFSGQCTHDVRQKILRFKRQLREGPNLEPGDFLNKRYKLHQIIGSGGFATVWKSWDKETRTVVAIKVLHGQWVKDKNRRDRFFRGARQMKKLNHPGIVRVLDEKIEDGGYYYFVMEYLSGGTLRELGKNGKLTTQQIVNIILQIGDAIDHAHGHDMVHRDVKPLNILLDANGEAKLTDFDLVKAADTTGGTRTGAMGSFVYSAPEAMENAKESDHRADIYSLGMTAFFLFHKKDIPVSVIYAQKQFCNKVECPQALKEVLLKAIAIAPEKRYQAVEEFCDRLKNPLRTLSSDNRPASSLSLPEKVDTDKKAESKELIIEPEKIKRWIRIEPGEFLMGSPDDEPGRWKHEGPVHKVRITRPFLLKSTPVTQDEWRVLMGNNPSYFKGGSSECPVEQVNWWEALAFCNALSLRDGFETCYELKISNKKKPGEDMECESVTFKGLDCTGYRLPTEAEWEYAARAGTTGAIYSNNLDDIAWYDKNSSGGTHPVGQKKPNSWDLYDMLGNAYEWTWDCYGDYGKNTVNDPVGPDRIVLRVFRSGGFSNYARYCRSANRYGNGPGYRRYNLGFRVARSTLGNHG